MNYTTDWQINPEDSIDWFEENAHKILSRYEGPCETMIDLGAHVGMVSVLATKEYGFDFAVAVEPELENYVHLLDNIAIGDCEGKVLPLWAAIGEESYKIVNLYTIPVKNKYNPEFLGLNSGTHSLEYQENFPKQSVTSLRLIDVVRPFGERTIDFLKVDIEGGEWRLLTEENQSLFEKVGYIDIELHPETDEHLFRNPQKNGTPAKAKAYFRKLGFKLTDNPDTFGFYGHRK